MVVRLSAKVVVTLGGSIPHKIADRLSPAIMKLLIILLARYAKILGFHSQDSGEQGDETDGE